MSGNGTRSSTKEGLGMLGLGAAACAACCAGPILGFLTAIGIGTILGVAVFGALGLLIAVPLTVGLLRRRRARTCAATAPVIVATPTRKQRA